MKINWDKWLYYNADMFMRHIGTAGMAATAGLYVSGHWNWESFFASLLAGAVLPTLFTIFSKGLPPDEEEKEVK